MSVAILNNFSAHAIFATKGGRADFLPG